MKKRIVTAVVLLVIFIAALAGFSLVLNRGTDDTTADMGGAVLPVISFEESGFEVNRLPGYAESMDISSMRDMLLPVSVGTSAEASISGYTGKISSLTYEVFSLDGKKSFKEETVRDVNDAVNIELGDSIADGEEKVLRIKLELEHDKKAYYYMRVVRAAEFNVQQCLEFAEDFHNKTMNSEELSGLKTYLNAADAPEGDGLQRVTLASSLEEMGWGSLKPQTEGDIRYEIKESNETYTSVVMKYRVRIQNGEDSGDTDVCNVTEFFKVRFLKGKASLEAYERTVNQVFSGTSKDFTKDGILPGIADRDAELLATESGDVVTFVNEREVWNYNKKENQVSLVFSFANSENNDVRNYNDNHEVHLLGIDKTGNTTFAVYGYMNRGIHEGQTGVAVYYYNLEENYVEEKAFIPCTQSGEIVAKEMDELIYYNHAENILYVMMEGTLYETDLEKQEKKVLVTNLKEEQYASSEDGRYIAFQSPEKKNTLEILNLETGKSNVVTAGDGEIIQPLGFVLGDAVYGVGRTADAGRDTSGEAVSPLYRLEIRNSKNEVVKSYQTEGEYILDARIEGNMITLDRVKKGSAGYETITQDYITNNADQEKKGFEFETVTSEPKLLKPKQKLFETPTILSFNQKEETDKYYVYGYGRLCDVCETAGEAIEAADTVRGVVVNSSQKKVWERGNRLLRYSMEDAAAFAAKSGESSLAACIRQMLAYNGKNVDVAGELAKGKSAVEIIGEYSGGEALELTGCTLEEICYIIGKGTPVVAMTGGDSAILLTGYDDTTITYLNPASGKKPTETISAVESMISGGQGVMLGYVK